MREIENTELTDMIIFGTWNIEESPSVLWTTHPKESKVLKQDTEMAFFEVE
jgi:hypothetical protein